MCCGAHNTPEPRTFLDIPTPLSLSPIPHEPLCVVGLTTPRWRTNPLELFRTLTPIIFTSFDSYSCSFSSSLSFSLSSSLPSFLFLFHNHSPSISSSFSFPCPFSPSLLHSLSSLSLHPLLTFVRAPPPSGTFGVGWIPRLTGVRAFALVLTLPAQGSSLGGITGRRVPPRGIWVGPWVRGWGYSLRGAAFVAPCRGAGL